MTVNVDPETGIHYGVIPKKLLFNYAEDFYAYAVNATFNEIVEHVEEHIKKLSDYMSKKDINELIEVAIEKLNEYGGRGEDVLEYNKNNYIMWSRIDDPDIMIIKSPYYTYAPPCSPCAPGAGYLPEATTDGKEQLGQRGLKTYCLPEDWFEEGECPYNYWEV